MPNLGFMAFEIGDIVKYLNQQGGGRVIAILDNGKVKIEDELGFDFEVASDELVSKNKSKVNLNTINDRLGEFKSNLEPDHRHESRSGLDYHALMRDYLLASKNIWTSKKKDFIEIDLHIEELATKPGRLSDGEKLNYQLNHAKECLYTAVDLKLNCLVFIHGVGAGVLRHDLRAWLKTLDYISFENADHRRYGIGATQVRIHGHHY